jgi:hypothetical protein
MLVRSRRADCGRHPDGTAARVRITERSPDRHGRGVDYSIASVERLFAFSIMLIGLERVSGFCFRRGHLSSIQVDAGAWHELDHALFRSSLEQRVC